MSKNAPAGNAKKNNTGMIAGILLSVTVLVAGLFLFLQLSKGAEEYQDAAAFDIRTDTTMAVTKGKIKLTEGSVPIQDRKIVQSFYAKSGKMDQFLIKFRDFSPEDTATLIVTLTDGQGREYYRYTCPTNAFGEGPYFYLAAILETELKANRLYYINVSLEGEGSEIAVCTTSKKGTHRSVKKLTVDGEIQKDSVFFLGMTYHSDLNYRLICGIFLGFALAGILATMYIPSKIPCRIWDYTDVLFLTAAAFFCFQITDRNGYYTLETEYFWLNGFLIFGALLFIKGLLPKVSFYVSDVLMVIWAAVNYYVIQFKGEEFLLTQLSAFSTTVSVAGNYNYELTPKILCLIGAGISLLLVQIASDVKRAAFHKTEAGGKKGEGRINEKPEIRKKWMGFLLERVLFLVAGFLIVFAVYKNKLASIPMFSLETGISKEGYILSNVCCLRQFRVEKPSSYSKSEVERIISQIPEPALAAGEVQPKNLIVIMNESFSDLAVLGELNTNEDYMPYIRSMDKNTIKGSTFVNVFGGSTSVSEYEFLTGNFTNRFLPVGANPYVGYCRKGEAGMVRTLKDQGYHTVAMHPYAAKNWNRNNVYPAMGFDEFIDEEGYEGAERIRNFVSDEGDYQAIIEYVNGFDSEEKLFIFNVTMQNHGGYTEANGTMEKTVFVEGMEDTDTQQADTYLSLIEKSDEAFRHLVEYFSEVEDPTMIVMFGDHLPKLSGDFNDKLYGKPAEERSPEEKNHMYTTQYVIWTNYDSDFEEPEEISLNYFGSFVLRLAGAELTEYDKFLLNLREEIPAMGREGARLKDGSFVGYTDLNSSMLKDYGNLEYLRVIDRNKSLYDIFRINE